MDVNNSTSPRIWTRGSRSAAMSRTRMPLKTNPAMMPTNGRSTFDYFTKLKIFRIKNSIWYNLQFYFDVIPHSTDVNLRLAVENVPLSSTWILCLNVVIVHLKSGIGTRTSQSHDMVFSVINFNGHFAQTVIVRSHVVRSVQMTFHLILLIEILSFYSLIVRDSIELNHIIATYQSKFEKIGR